MRYVFLQLIFYNTISIGKVKSFSPYISLHRSRAFTTTTSLSDTLEPIDIATIPDSVSYTITSESPLGIILSEYQSSTVSELTPLVVTDVTEMSNGAMAGVRQGDILLGVNGLSALSQGVGFTQVTDSIKAAFDDDDDDGKVTIKFFRGSVQGNEEGFDRYLDVLVNGVEYNENEEEVDGEYEAPTLEDFGISMEKKEVGVGELFSALFKESAKAVQKGLESSKQEKPAKKKKKSEGGGIFDIFKQETIQIDENPNRFSNPVDDEARNRN